MSQPKSNEDWVNEFLNSYEAHRNTVFVMTQYIMKEWKEKLVEILAQKDAEVATKVKEEEHATLTWVNMIMGYKHPNEVRQLIEKKLVEIETSPKE